MRDLIWVTGGSSGIGREILRSVPWEGAETICISRGAGPEGSEHLAADLSDPASWPLLAADFERRLSGFDGERAICVHCAANASPIAPVREAELDAYTDVVLLNSAAAQVIGAAFVLAAATAAVPATLALFTSRAATQRLPGFSSYSASKAGIDRWVDTVAAEEARREPGCRVFAFSPGLTATRMVADAMEVRSDAVPTADHFRRRAAEGKVRDPAWVAGRFWKTFDDVEPGSVVELDLASAPS